MINIFLSLHANKYYKIYSEFKNQLVHLQMNEDKAISVSKGIVLYGLMSGSSIEEIKFSSITISQMYAAGKCYTDDINGLIESSPYLMQDFSKHLGLKVGQLRCSKLTPDQIFSSIHSNSEKLLTEASKISSAKSFLKLLEGE